MTMFGAFYFIAPRVTRCEWLSARMIGFHYWASAYGVLSLVVLITVGGLAQGVDIAAWEKPFIVSVEKVRPWGIAQCIGWLLILLSNLMFLFHVLLMSLRFGRRGDEGPTLLAAGHGAKTGELNTGGAQA
jgi:cytochrome c oxidase cbb3-type subunit 1